MFAKKDVKTVLIAKRATCLDCSKNLKQQKGDHIICCEVDFKSWVEQIGEL